MKLTGYRCVAVVAAGLCLGIVASGAPKKKQPAPVDEAAIKKAMPAKASTKGNKGRKILVFNLCKGFYHKAIPTGSRAFEIMGEKTGAFSADVSKDMAVFTKENLAQYDAILFNNTTKLPFKGNEAAQKAVMDFVKGGKGIIGIHAATDNFYDWPEAAEMMGGLFSGHPWTAGGTWAIKLDEPDHPLNNSFGGKGFKIKDELYQFKAPYTRDKLRVLLSIDLSDPKTGERKGKREDKDYAVSWVRPFGKGRVFYCSLGHNNEVFYTSAVLGHMLAGIQYALGDLEIEDAPVSK